MNKHLLIILLRKDKESNTIDLYGIYCLGRTYI